MLDLVCSLALARLAQPICEVELQKHVISFSPTGKKEGKYLFLSFFISSLWTSS